MAAAEALPRLGQEEVRPRPPTAPSARGRASYRTTRISGSGKLPPQLASNPLCERLTAPPRRWFAPPPPAPPIPPRTSRLRPRTAPPAYALRTPREITDYPYSSKRLAAGAIDSKILGVEVHTKRSRAHHIRDSEAELNKRELFYYQQDQNYVWRDRLSRSPFLVDQLAERERIEEEARVQAIEEARQRRIQKQQKTRMETAVILAALKQAEEEEMSREQWRMLLEAERARRTTARQMDRRRKRRAKRWIKTDEKLADGPVEDNEVPQAQEYSDDEARAPVAEAPNNSSDTGEYEVWVIESRQLARIGEPLSVRLEVDGREVARSRLAAPPDPWAEKFNFACLRKHDLRFVVMTEGGIDIAEGKFSLFQPGLGATHRVWVSLTLLKEDPAITIPALLVSIREVGAQASSAFITQLAV